jgi:hypothetical protein
MCRRSSSLDETLPPRWAVPGLDSDVRVSLFATANHSGDVLIVRRHPSVAVAECETSGIVSISGDERLWARPDSHIPTRVESARTQSDQLRSGHPDRYEPQRCQSARPYFGGTQRRWAARFGDGTAGPVRGYPG